MTWYRVTARGSTRDLWLDVTGPDAPRWGRWTTPSGLDVDITLGDVGPGPIDVAMWWAPSREHYGKRLTDLVWNTGGMALKIASERLVELLQAHGAELQVFGLDIRWRTGDQIPGYVGFLETVDEVGPVRSVRPGKRSGHFLVDQTVLDAMRAANLIGIEFAPVKKRKKFPKFDQWLNL